MAGWVALDEARDLWDDADRLTDEVLAQYLDSAGEACEAFAPDPVLDEAEQPIIPESWRMAQVLQARAIYRSVIAGRNDQLGADGFPVTVFPLDWNVKQLLRPKRGRISVR